MTTQISVETLSPITHNQIPVITTELLAQLYGTEPVRIRQNHHENKVRFVEGKHFFKVVGNDLKELRVALNYSQNLRVTLSNSQNLQPSLRGLQISPESPLPHPLDRTRSSPSCQNARNRSGVGCVRKAGRLLFQSKGSVNASFMPEKLRHASSLLSARRCHCFHNSVAG